MRSTLILSVVAAILLAGSAQAESTIEDKVRASFVREFLEGMAGPIRESIIESGYSETEADAFLKTMAIGYANCNLDFFLSRPEEEFKFALELMSDERNKAKFEELMGDRYRVVERILELEKEQITGCYHTAFQKVFREMK